MSRRRRRPLSVRPSVRPSRRPSHRRRPSSVRPLSVRPRPSVVVVRPLSVRPVVRPVVVVRPLSVRPVVRLNITCKTSRSIHQKGVERTSSAKTGSVPFQALA